MDAGSCEEGGMLVGSNKKMNDRQVRVVRQAMRLDDVTAEAPAPAGLRCDMHGVGRARGAFVSGFTGMVLVVAAMVAFMIGARPATAHAKAPTQTTSVATTAGVGLSALGVSGFIVSQVIDRRTRYHVWLQCEARAITGADVGELIDTTQVARTRVDRGWTADQVWIAGSGVEEAALSLARAHGVRCFVAEGEAVREV